MSVVGVRLQKGRLLVDFGCFGGLCSEVLGILTYFGYCVGMFISL